MNFYFVYSGGGGAGDWGGVNRIWNNAMPDYFKDHLLIKFGDIFFNHKGTKFVFKQHVTILWSFSFKCWKETRDLKE